MPMARRGLTARVSTITIARLIFVSLAAARASARARRPLVSQASPAKTRAQIINGPITSANGWVSRPIASVRCDAIGAPGSAPLRRGRRMPRLAESSINARRGSSGEFARDPLEAGHHPLPAVARALEEGFVLWPEAGLFHPHLRSALRRREGPGDDALDAVSGLLARRVPAVDQARRRLDLEDLAVGHAVPAALGRRAKVEPVANNRLEIVLNQPFADQLGLGQGAPDLLRRMGHEPLDDDGAGSGDVVHGCVLRL